MAAGEYEVVARTHTTPGGQVVPLGLACRASMADYLEADDILDTTRKGLDYYTGLFATDYPFAKYDQVFVPEYSVGATENAGCVVFTDQLLFRSRVTDTLYELRASVILHEMAHMWFGDLVTMRWWDDLWLNESFAEFCAALASAEATRYAQAWTTFSSGRKAWGYVQDQLPSTHPIAADVPTLSEAIANFDGISYAKGASVLRQLVARIGRDSFFAGIRAYLADHGWGNATLADWLQPAGGQLGPQPRRLVEGLAGDGRARAPCAASSRSAPTARSPHSRCCRRRRRSTRRCGRTGSRIGLYNRVGRRRSSARGQVPADIAGPRTEIPELAGVRQPDLLLLNDDDLTYALVRFDDRSIATLTDVDRPAQRFARPRGLLERSSSTWSARPSCRCPGSSPWWRAAWRASRRSLRSRACSITAGICCARWPIRRGRHRLPAARGSGRPPAAGRRAGQRPPACLGTVAELDRDVAGAARSRRRPAGRQRRARRADRRLGAAMGAAATAGRRPAGPATPRSTPS